MIASEPSSGSLIFNDTATTEIYTLSLHDALPILGLAACPDVVIAMTELADRLEIVAAERVRVELEKLLLGRWPRQGLDRKSTRLNSSHANISYAVFCLKNNKLLGRVLLEHLHPLL